MLQSLCTFLPFWTKPPQRSTQVCLTLNKSQTMWTTLPLKGLELSKYVVCVLSLWGGTQPLRLGSVQPSGSLGYFWSCQDFLTKLFSWGVHAGAHLNCKTDVTSCSPSPPINLSVNNSETHSHLTHPHSPSCSSSHLDLSETRGTNPGYYNKTCIRIFWELDFVRRSKTVDASQRSYDRDMLK